MVIPPPSTCRLLTQQMAVQHSEAHRAASIAARQGTLNAKHKHIHLSPPQYSHQLLLSQFHGCQAGDGLEGRSRLGRGSGRS